MGPKALRNAERSLAILAGAAPDLATAMNVLTAVMTYVMGAVLREQQEERSQQDQRRTQELAGLSEDDMATVIGSFTARLRETGRYPNMVAMISDGVDPDAPETRDDSWLDWTLASAEPGSSLASFTARLLAVRRDKPHLRAAQFAAGEEVGAGLKDVEWLDERCVALADDDWANGEGRALVMRRAVRREDGVIEVVALLMNASDKPIDFLLPPEWHWEFLVDSADPHRAPGHHDGDRYTLSDRACVILATTVAASP